MDSASGLAVLAKAAARNGLSIKGVEIIRNGSHLMCRLDIGLIARIGQAGKEGSARREVAVARWLTSQNFDVVRLVEGPIQPTVIGNHAVTWWEELPAHRPATPGELGSVLRRLHSLPRPDIALPHFSPFQGILTNIAQGNSLDGAQRTWLEQKIDTLRQVYTTTVLDSSTTLIHGDAWQGNIAVPYAEPERPVLLDLESVCLGPRAWDLIAIAVDYVDFSRISSCEYSSFVDAYGQDVRTEPTFSLLAEIQELRWTSYVIAKSQHDPAAAAEAAHRISCLQGNVTKPWSWRAF